MPNRSHFYRRTVALIKESQMSRPPGRTRPVLRLAGRLATVAAVAIAATVALASPGQAAGPLRTVAGNKFIGFAANADLLCSNTAACTSGSNATYRSIANTEFNQVTPENAMKWDATEPNQNQFNFTAADGIVANAVANNQIVHGHTMLWHSQAPGWLQSLTGAALKSALQNHIMTVMGRYANNSAVKSWDVVNEAINDNSSPQLRQDFWTQNYPGDFIHDAFTFARAADPDATLCINDYNVEGSPDSAGSKSQRLFQLVQSEKAMGTPIDCVGLQSHFIVGQIPDLQTSMARYASLGVTVRISELDIRIPLPGTDAQFQTQAQNYASVVTACKAVAACGGLTIWGIDDGHSWLPNSCCPEGVPLLWNSSFQKKPAYDATANAFGTGPADTTAPTVPTGLTSSNVTSSAATLSWTASTDNVGVTGYDVLRAPGASGGTFTVVGSPTTTTFTDTGLAASSTFRYEVRAKDAAGNVSAVTAPVSVTTLGGSTGGGCSVTLVTQTTWQTGYVIQPSRVTNTGTTAITGWTVTVTLPAGHAITGFWNATESVSGQTVTFHGVSFNSNLAPGASGEFGFQASRPDGNTALPTATCSAP
jgi:endo-1,4-beta-xylanase